MTIKPLEDRVVVKPAEAAEQKKGGIIIPDTAKERPDEGKVISVGPGKTMENGQVKPMSLKKGDKILFAKYSGNEILINAEKHLIMKEEDVLAVIE